MSILIFHFDSIEGSQQKIGNFRLAFGDNWEDNSSAKAKKCATIKIEREKVMFQLISELGKLWDRFSSLKDKGELLRAEASDSFRTAVLS